MSHLYVIGVMLAISHQIMRADAAMGETGRLLDVSVAGLAGAVDYHIGTITDECRRAMEDVEECVERRAGNRDDRISQEHIEAAVRKMKRVCTAFSVTRPLRGFLTGMAAHAVYRLLSEGLQVGKADSFLAAAAVYLAAKRVSVMRLSEPSHD